MLVRCLNGIERAGACTEGIAQCGELEAMITAASLERSLEDALVAEVIVTQAGTTADEGEQLRLWHRLKDIAPDHPRLARKASKTVS